ncbi:MAG: ribosome biogenesis GTP-binding protein YihA/YsxC [Muribaculaceae bacterium]|nr:ribosome biogenesis GTP-binding protein YihA/YsxC [Muribaculaceae bacterium]
MIVNSARFVVSNSTVASCPDEERHEYAFIGRSNVGKSSLINMLTGNRKLAMTSATPGKTTLINHFLVNDSWYIVDLPGYGFAMRSKEGRKQIDRIIREYILHRPQMTNLFLLIDVRHDPQKIDLEFMDWLGENGVPFSIVFTKLDKLSPTAGKKQMAKYCEMLLEKWEELPPVFATSSADGRGRGAILDYIEELNRLPVASAADEKDVGESSEEIDHSEE